MVAGVARALRGRPPAPAALGSRRARSKTPLSTCAASAGCQGAASGGGSAREFGAPRRGGGPPSRRSARVQSGGGGLTLKMPNLPARAGMPWSVDEHYAFLQGLEKLGEAASWARGARLARAPCCGSGTLPSGPGQDQAPNPQPQQRRTPPRPAAGQQASADPLQARPVAEARNPTWRASLFALAQLVRPQVEVGGTPRTRGEGARLAPTTAPARTATGSLCRARRERALEGTPRSRLCAPTSFEARSWTQRTGARGGSVITGSGQLWASGAFLCQR